MPTIAKYIKNSNIAVLIVITSILSCNANAREDGVSGSQNNVIDAISAGKLDLNMRLRYEHVDDQAAIANADALTLRTALGYTTGKFHDLSARVLVQDVRAVGVDNYNDGTGRSAVRARYAVVADPADTDFLEAYLAYGGVQDTLIKLGRQLITYRPGPLHRFIGTVGWRQNWQNHDAVTLVNKSIKDVTLSYAYSWNINRIFTDKAVISARANFEGDTHLFNIQYTGFGSGKLEAYAYLLDFDNAAANSSATYGVRFSGAYPMSNSAKLLYAAEYATQDDYGNNPAKLNEDYFAGEIGVNFKLSEDISSVTLKFDYELLAGNGTTGFRTPLATAHAYQGWADRFLSTPADGIQDWYFTAGATAFGFNLAAVYHRLSSDHQGYDYGSEIDLQVTRKLFKHLTLGLKYSDYNADANTLNVARNGAIAKDVSKFWTWLMFTY